MSGIVQAITIGVNALAPVLTAPSIRDHAYGLSRQGSLHWMRPEGWEGVPSFSPIVYRAPGYQLKLRLWKPWRARGDWGGKNFTLGWYETREEAERVEKEWRANSEA